MKTYPITFSTHFQSNHPRAGDPTGFVEKIENGQKIHTIRGNYEYWNDRVQSIRADKGVLSMRTWTGKPYRSKQQEFLQCENVGIQKANITDLGCIYVNGEMLVRHAVATNDGLSHNDFHAWFSGKLPFEGAIIHWADFRY